MAGLNGRQTPNRPALAQRWAPWTKTALNALRLEVLRTNEIGDQNGNSGLNDAQRSLVSGAEAPLTKTGLTLRDGNSYKTVKDRQT